MDPASEEAESRERAVSSEPSSIRPNPFHDGESSRKRRRTSLNGSARSQSVDTVQSPSGLSTAAEAEPARDLGRGKEEEEGDDDDDDSTTMKLDPDSDTPQTPDRQLPAVQPGSGPMSSRVTINLRSAQRPLQTIPSSPLSPQSPSPPEPLAAEDDVKISVEESEVDIPAAEVPMEATGSSPGEGRSSPPADLLPPGSSPEEVGSSPRVDLLADDDEDVFETHEPQVTMLHGIQDSSLYADPIRDFPYRSPVETWTDTMAKIVGYLTTNEDVARQMGEWLDGYLAHVRNLQPYQVLTYVDHNRTLWWAFIDLIWQCTPLRTSDFASIDEATRPAVLAFAQSFARLAAHFVELDMRMLDLVRASETNRLRDLVSPPYLLALASLLRGDGSRADDTAEHVAQRDEVWAITHQFQVFHRAHGGSLSVLNDLMTTHLELMPRHPKLIDSLGAICTMVAVVVREAERRRHAPAQAQLAREHLQPSIRLGQQFFKMASDALSVLVEKHLTSLSADNATQHISALAELVNVSLRIDSPETDKLLDEFQSRYPTIDRELAAEVYALEWKYTMLRRLIMCSQMPLRVMAVTSLCLELVNCWRKYGDAQEVVPHAGVLHFVSGFLIETGLVPYLLGPTCHPEITAEASNIVGFLAVTKTYTSEHSDLLWQTITSTQDPRIAEALVRMMTRIANLFSYDVLVYLCQKLLTLPVESFNNVMRDYCEAIFRHIFNKAAQDRRPQTDQTPYAVCLRLLKESSVVGARTPMAHPEVQAFAIDRLTDMLKTFGIDAAGRQQFYLSCLEDIRAGSPSTLGSLWGVNIMSRSSNNRDLQDLAHHHDLAALVVGELENATRLCQRTNHRQVISGNSNNPRRDMIFQIVTHFPSTLAPPLGVQLWNLLVGSGASCQEDRDASWLILNTVLKNRRTPNLYLTTCFTEHLPSLPPECFCDGLLEFVRESLLPLVDDAASIVLDDEESPGRGGLEQLWRIILTAPTQTIERQAISTLVNEVYIDSKSITSFSLHRARKVHLALVTRCLRQLSSAAAKLKSLKDATAGDDDQAMVLETSEGDFQDQESLFVRSLAVLREFHRLYRAKAHFAAPDLRSLIADTPNDMEGDSAELKFQSFDGDNQTEVMPLNIGKRNTAASLLASLKEATGFQNYRIYYKGQAFVPHEGDICKSLEDLRIHNGLILVKREADVVPSSSTRIRPGASPVEIEILNHFEELWDFLSMEYRLAQEVYYFLIRLPVDEHVLQAFQTDSVSHRDIFPVGQPFKCLYAVHALRELLAARRRSAGPLQRSTDPERAQAATAEYAGGLAKVLSLMVAALCDDEVINRCTSQELRIVLSTSLVDSLVHVLKDPLQPGPALGGSDVKLATRLLEILSATTDAPPTETSTRLIHLTFQALLECCLTSRAFWTAFQQQLKPSLLGNLLLRDLRPAVRKLTAKLIGEKVSYMHSGAAVSASDFREFFWPLVLDLLPEATQNPHKCEDVFGLLSVTLKLMWENKSPALNSRALLGHVGSLLLEYSTFEDVTLPEQVDYVAHGLIRILHTLLAYVDNPTDSHAALPPDFSQGVFWKHLYPPWQDHEDALAPRVVLNQHSRGLLIQTLFALRAGNESQLSRLVSDLDRLVPFSDEDDDPYHYELHYQFERSRHVRSSAGYVGLRNLSNTCYLNSLFTQLFMNVEFRRFMLSVEIRDDQYSQKLLFQTRTLFGFMQDSIRRAIDPLACAQSIKTYEDTPIDIHNQMDVDEFYNLLFDRWEGQLLGADTKKAFRSFYGGQLVQQVRSKECEHVSERLEPFSAIQCDIKGKTSLQESLQAYVDGEIMEGDNKYKCSTCDRHVDAVKRACLKDIPDHLIFHLKRFEFNLRTLQRSKINDHFTFPHKIDMRPYTIDQLSGPSEEGSTDIFELVGILVHSGTAESGHYYSFIRERPSSQNTEVWVEFNDDTVSHWDPAQMEGSCFGGVDYRSHYEGGVPVDKSFSAYMLFYQRSSSLERNQAAMADAGTRSPIRAPMPADLATHIRRENSWLVRRHCLYDPAQIPFVNRVLAQVRHVAGGLCSQAHETEDLAIQMALSHLDQVASRAKDVPDFQSLLSRIQSYCQTCPMCSLAVQKYFSERHEAMRSLVQRNPEPVVRQEAAHLIIRALQAVKQAAPELYGLVRDDDDDDYPNSPSSGNNASILRGTTVMLAVLWDMFHVNLRSWPEVFGMMLAFIHMGRHEKAMFMDEKNFWRVVLTIAADPNVTLDNQYSRLANTLQRRLPTRQPSFEAIISIIDELLSVLYIPTRPYAAEVDGTRLELVQADPNAELPMDEDEARVLRRDWGKNYPNVFMEKLIALNQNHLATESILARLMEMEPVMDAKLFTTLKGNISAQANAVSQEPFLRAAIVYCRRSSRPESAQAMLRYVSTCCRGLQNNDGKAFLDFQQEMFLERGRGDVDGVEARLQALEHLPTWAPGLLGYFDTDVGNEVETFLQDQIFSLGLPRELEESESTHELVKALEAAVQHLGIECLKYLRDYVVGRNVHVGNQAVAGLQRVVGRCKDYYTSEEGIDGELSAEYARLKQAVLEPLHQLIVEDLEEDASGTWTSDAASVASSESTY